MACKGKKNLRRVRFGRGDWILLAVVIGLALTVSESSAQHISNLVLPTEEEALAALESGDISPEEYEILLDLYAEYPLSSYADSLELLQALQDALPNLDLIAGQNLRELQDLQREQVAPFVEMDATVDRPVEIDFRAYSDIELTDDKQSRRVLHGAVTFGDWRVRGAADETYTSELLWRRRALEYTPNDHWLKRVTLGSDNLRSELGVALGGSRTLVERPDSEDMESLLFPNRGGINGVTVAMESALSEAVTLASDVFASYTRDNRYRINSWGTLPEFELEDVTFGGTFTHAKITQRADGIGWTQNQAGLSVDSKIGDLRTVAEGVLQDNNGVTAGAVVIEARYQPDQDNIRAAYWNYSNDFVNLLGSGRSGLVYETVMLDPVGFEFNDRRVDQSGVLVRSLSPIADFTRIEFGFDRAENGEGELRSEYLVALHHELTKTSDVKLEFGADRRVDGTVTEPKRWHARGDWDFQNDAISTRSAVTVYERNESRHVGLFWRWRQTLNNGMRYEFWANASDIVTAPMQLMRSYFYARISAPIDENGTVRAASKLIYRYSRTASVTSRWVARLELEGRL